MDNKVYCKICGKEFDIWYQKVCNCKGEGE